MTHLGSAKDVGEVKGRQMVIDGLAKMLKGYQGQTRFLIENSAGSGQVIGDTFEEIGEIIKKTEKQLKKHNVIGVCLDTQHAFASGYDWRRSINDVLKKFDQTIGLKRLVIMHANDSLSDFGSHVDRHADIGQGKMGKKVFEQLIKNPKLRKVNLLLETPENTVMTYKKAIQFFKQVRDGRSK